MAENRQITPEKQLLKLIENSKSEGGKPPAPGHLIKPPLLNLLSFGALRGALFGRFSFFKRTTQKKINSSKLAFSFAAANKVLMGMIVFFFLYFLGGALASAINLSRSPNFAFQNDKSLVSTSDKISPLKEESYYLQKAAARDIFKEFKEPEASKEILQPDENETIKNLSLVGISWSANPDVIIEDKSSQRTFFLKRGQMVVSGVKVETIFKDKVVLSYEGQEFELK